MSYHFLGIGLNYAGTSNALRGCINDARSWLEFFSPIVVSNPRVMIEGEATRLGIIGAITSLLKKLQAGDTAIITYSGHGTFVPDLDGDEPDRADEAIVPWDMNDGLILDDTLREMFLKKPADTKVLFISDCCHSGTLTRAHAPVLGTPRYIPFDEIGSCMCTVTRNKLRDARKKAREFGSQLPIPGLAHFAGCRDKQVSYDVNIHGTNCGAFSYYAVSALRGKAKGFTYGDWDQAIRIPPDYPQNPVFNGDVNAVVPGFETSIPVPPPPPPPPGPTLPAEGTMVLNGAVYDVKKRA